MNRPNPLRATPRLLFVLLAVAVTGCTLKTDGSTSSVTLNMPGAVPPHPAITPGAIAAASGPPPSGNFVGTGHLSSRMQIRISHFIVDGNRVRYQGFRGTIQGGSFVQMQQGGAFISGIFDGDRFTGHLWRPHPECTYDLVLMHAG
jgi:hypothetical protein